MSKKPLCVAISDIHFSLTNLPLASAALRMAVDKSNELEIPLVIAGDLHDTKAIIRAEVMNAILHILSYAKQYVYILVGNHDLVNEKGLEHGLTYLHNPVAGRHVVSEFTYFLALEAALIPYQNSAEAFNGIVSSEVYTSILFIHQGVQGAAMGDYAVDRTSVSADVLKGFKVISGHYHRHQTIGPVTYIGSPYTVSFGEANDPAKGFLVVNIDGSFERVLTNLPKHVILELNAKQVYGPYPGILPEDKLWLKVTGTNSELDKLDKNRIGKAILGHSNFKLDKIYTEIDKEEVKEVELTDYELMDKLIDGVDDALESKQRLKNLYRNLVTK